MQREHTTNRALLSQELAFLDHLLSLTGGNLGGYDAGGELQSNANLMMAGRQRVLDVEC